MVDVKREQNAWPNSVLLISSDKRGVCHGNLLLVGSVSRAAGGSGNHIDQHCLVLGWHKVDSSTEEVLRRVIQQTVQECTVTTTTTVPPPLPSVLNFSWSLRVEIVLVFVIVIGLVSLVCRLCNGVGLVPFSAPDRASDSPISDKSPVSIQALAHNQLAEIRLRRYGIDQPNRTG